MNGRAGLAMTTRTINVLAVLLLTPTSYVFASVSVAGLIAVSRIVQKLQINSREICRRGGPLNTKQWIISLVSDLEPIKELFTFLLRLLKNI